MTPALDYSMLSNEDTEKACCALSDDWLKHQLGGHIHEGTFGFVVRNHKRSLRLESSNGTGWTRTCTHRISTPRLYRFCGRYSTHATGVHSRSTNRFPSFCELTE